MTKGVLEKYKAYLPVTDDTPVFSLGEGDTPLVKSRAIGDMVGCDELYFKLEGCNTHRVVQGSRDGCGGRDPRRP